MNAIPGEIDIGHTAASRLRARIKRCVITSQEEFLADRNGNPQRWLLDLRMALLDGESLTLVAESFWKGFAPLWPFQIAAQELAGVPILGALLVKGAALGFPVNGVIIRNERKTYGRQRLIEGELTQDPVILIDDLFFTGASLDRAADILAAEKASLCRLFAVVDFETIPGYTVLGRRRIGLERLFSAADLGLDGQAAPPGRLPSAPPLQTLWRFEPGERRFSHVTRKAAPVVSDGRVLHASEDGFLTALDAVSGDILWAVAVARRARKGVWSTPCVGHGRVYVGSYDGAVLALEAETGEQRWRFDGADWVGSSPCLSQDGARLYIGLEHAAFGGCGSIACIDSGTGDLLWEHHVPALVHASPFVLAGSAHVVCGANDGALRCLDGKTGALMWRVDLGGAIKGGVTSDGARLFAGSCDGTVTALGIDGGAIHWRHDTGGPVFATPLLHHGRLVVASTSGEVLSFDPPSGAVAARTTLTGKAFAAPRPDGDELLVGTTSGALIRLAGADLAVLAEHQFPERIVSEIAVGAAHIFVPTFDGQLFAVRPL
jgi:outer membrane protein assembly factor BamB/orotate phosphoribosyltransferase